MKKTNQDEKTVILNGVEVGKVPSTGNLDKDAEVALQLLKDKGLYKKTTPFQAIFNQAVAFANTSAYLYERDLRKTPRKGISISPFVVNSAFSIELYLKALAMKHGKCLRGHELSKLYETLPSTAHKEIESVIPRCATNRALEGIPNFSEYLNQLNSAFVDWRYCYEFDKLDTVHVEPTIFAMEVLHEACRLPLA